MSLRAAHWRGSRLGRSLVPSVAMWLSGSIRAMLGMSIQKYPKLMATTWETDLLGREVLLVYIHYTVACRGTL
ncbi:uncharacterized protein P884DRAFT_257783 [Thermothelomyces heterothallicus CBS 202.75]|uniref:uncharacterized protein n=1 Tax=Thermothelomyces heterothallicus CBS 202.75 TaxID=1149848 RepID=UPI003744A246